MAGRQLAALIGTVALAPVALAAGFVAGIAALSEIASGWFGLFDVDSWFEGITWFDWLTGGPGATPGSGVRYVAFMVGGVVALLCGYGVVALWSWAVPRSRISKRLS